MQRIRFQTWVFLALAAAFFLIRDFRVASESPRLVLLPAGWSAGFGAGAEAREARESLTKVGLDVVPDPLGNFFWLTRILERSYTLERYVSPDEFLRLGREAISRKDCEFLAFAAMHAPRTRRQEIREFGDHLAACPDQTWVLSELAARLEGDQSAPQPMLAWIKNVEAWDAENAAPIVAHADFLKRGRPKIENEPASNRSAFLAAVTQEMEWFRLMEAAFGKSRMDPYLNRRFDLERRVLQRRGWDNPPTTTLLLTGSGPTHLTLVVYARLAVDKVAADAADAGRKDEALRNYRSIARFGAILLTEDEDVLERVVGLAVQAIVNQRLAPALREAGHAAEAATLEANETSIRRELNHRGDSPALRTTNRAWARFLLIVSGTLVWFLVLLNAICLVYLIARGQPREDAKTRLLRIVAAAEGYFAPALLASCLVLYLTYLPYAENFHYYMSTKEPVFRLYDLLKNSLPQLDLELSRFRSQTELPIQTTVLEYAGRALRILLFIAVLILTGIGLWRLFAFVRRRLQHVRLPAPVFAGLLAATMLFSLGYVVNNYLTLRSEAGELGLRRREVEAEQKRLAKPIADYRRTSELRRALVRKIELIDALRKRQPDSFEVLAEVGRALRQSPGVGRLKLRQIYDGFILDGISENPPQAAGFIAALKRGKMLKRVELDSAYPRSEAIGGGVGFSISARDTVEPAK